MNGDIERERGPIACSLSGADYRVRVREWESVAHRALVERKRVPRGVRLRFRHDGDVEETLRRLVRAEEECCPFLDLRLTVGGDDLVIAIEAPDEAVDLAEEFLRLPFAPDAPDATDMVGQ